MRPTLTSPAAGRARPPRVGLVLGAGGITGIAWLAGALEAIRSETGWDPAGADVVAGTSAGAIVAAVLTAGIEPSSLLRYTDAGVLAAATRRAMAGREPTSAGLPLPGSLSLGLTGLLLSGGSWQRVASVMGLLPGGRRPTDEIRGLTHEAVAGGWPSHAELWLHACDYQTGRRVTFGRPGAPAADLGCAVAASAAVPAYYQPVTIGGRRYVDGGLWSFTNADALADAGCDIVICLAPFSSRERESLLGAAVYGPLRAVTTRQLSREAQALRAKGTQVVTVEPVAADLRAMGINPMDRARSRAVLETARTTVGERVAALFADVAPARGHDAALPRAA